MPAINRVSLVKALTNFRTYRFDKGRENSHLLLDALDYNSKREVWQIEALLIKLVEDYCEVNNSNSDILLVAFGLLDSYEKTKFLIDRHLKYLEESTFIKDFYPADYEKYIKSTDDEKKEILKTVELRLRKTEEDMLKNIADYIVDEIINKGKLNSYIENIDDYVIEVDDPSWPRKKYQAKLPLPSYQINACMPKAAIQLTAPKSHNLTPDALRWDDYHILGRDDFVDSLCQDLLVGTPHLQLTGMGGIGKTEILQKVYLNFANNKLQHHFTHVGLIKFAGDLNSDLAQQINFTGNGTYKSVWDYLRDVSETNNVLLLIDDIRSPKEEKEPAEKSDNPFETLVSLKMTVILASRIQQKKFENRPVNPLSMDQCIQIFADQLFEGELNATLPSSLTPESLRQLEVIIRDRAGFNTLIVNRLGAMARDNGLSISMLSDRLESASFSICKGNADDFDDDEMLQDEINKLYRLEDIKHAVALNLLEAFAIFPHIPLKQETCVQWLKKDAGIDEDYCRRALKKLSKQTWLIFHNSRESDTGSFVMHQMVKSAITAQTSISYDKHISLIENCSDAINHNSKYPGKYKIIPKYLAHAASILNYFYTYQRLEIATLLSYLGRYFFTNEEFSRALEWQLKALSIRERLIGPRHLDVAAIYYDIAQIFEYIDKRKSLDYYFDGLSIRKEVLGCGHPDTTEIYHKIGDINIGVNNQEALKWHNEALGIRKDIFGEQHLLTAMSYHYIADVYLYMHKYAKALDLCLRAVKIYETNQTMDGEDYNKYILVCNKIFLIHLKQNNAEKMAYWVNRMREISMKYCDNSSSDYWDEEVADRMLEKCEEMLSMNCVDKYTDQV